MKELRVILFFFLISFQTFSQNSLQYFKVVPELNNSVPEWAQNMYSENPNVYDVVNKYSEYYKSNIFVKNTHTQNYKYWLKSIQAFVDSKGYINLNLKKRDYDFAKANNLRSKALNKRSNRSAVLWKNIGPNKTYKNDGKQKLIPTQSNVYSMGIAPSNTSILYAGTESKTLFRSSDKGISWNVIAKDYIFESIKDIKVHPTNPDLVYIANGGAIHRSLDGGVNWVLVLDNKSSVEQIYIDKNRPSTLFVATAVGLFKSTNSGSSWTNTLNEKCWDVVPHATIDNTLYVSISNIAAKKAEVYKSTDNGNTWTLKNTNWYVPTDINNAKDAGCKLATTLADPDRLYACLIGSSKTGDNGWIGVYYSLDNADTWVNPDGIDGGPYASGKDINTNWYYAGYFSNLYNQEWYNFDFEVSQQNADRLWVGTIWFMESNNRGENLESLRDTRGLVMHADTQDIEVVGNEIFISTDGGINYSNDECLTVDTRTSGISASTFWGFSQGWNEDVWTGGRYHNGNALYHENYGEGNTLFLGGAEEATGYVNPLNNKKAYYSDITDKIAPNSLNGIAKNNQNLMVYPNQSYFLLNSSEIEFHPNYANNLYLGKENKFYKSTDAGASFNVLFEFPIDSRVLEFEISRENPQNIYCLVKINNITKLYKSNNEGVSFSEITSFPFLNARVGFTLDKISDNHLWATNYDNNSTNKVFESVDGGTTWINRTSSILDNHRITEVAFQLGTTNTVYIVTTKGVFYWDSNASNWVEYNLGLPVTGSSIIKMIPFYRDSKLRLAGSKGVWEVPFVKSSVPVAQPMTATKEVSCYLQEIQFEDYSNLDHKNATWQWEFPGASYISSNTIRNPIVKYSSYGDFDVTLTVTDGNGQSSVKTFQDFITVGNDCSSDLTDSDGDTIPDENEIKSCGNTVTASEDLYGGSDFLITDFNLASTGSYYINLDITTNCYNKSANLQAIVNLNQMTINVLAYKHFDSTITTDQIENNLTSQVASFNTSYSKIGLKLVSNGSNKTLTFKHLNNACGSTGFDKVINACWSSLDVDNDGIPNHLDTDSDNDTIQDITEISNCENEIEASTDIIPGNSVAITNFGGSTSGVYYVNLNAFTSCYSETSNLKAFVDLDKKTFTVISYSHFAGTSEIIEGNGTDAIVSQSSSYSKIGYRLIEAGGTIQLYFDHLFNACSSTVNASSQISCYGTVDYDQDGIANYLDPDSDNDGTLDIDESRNCNQEILESVSILPGNSITVTNFDGATSGIYFTELDVITSCYNETAVLKVRVNLDEMRLTVYKYKHFGSSSTEDTTIGNATNEIISESSSFGKISLSIEDIGSTKELKLNHLSNPCGSSANIRLAKACLGSLDNNDNQLLDYLDTSSVVTLSVKNQTQLQNNIIAYPNPVTNNEVRFKNIKEDFSISIYTITGQQVLKTKVNLGEKLKLNKLSTGIYLYLLQTDTKLSTGKLIIN